MAQGIRVRMNDQLWAVPQIVSVKGLGTSWFRRSTGYWARRVLATLLYAIALSFGIILVGTIVLDINRSANLPGRIILWTVVISVIGVSHYFGFRDMNPNRRCTSSPAGKSTVSGAGLGAGAAAYGGSGLAGGLLAIGMFIGAGWIAAIFVYSLTRYTSSAETSSCSGNARVVLASPRDSERPAAQTIPTLGRAREFVRVVSRIPAAPSHR
ncbi:hypothetical protein [Nocardia sp. NPDC020380]|uniref:hypothetical protein n=1 Tax=Nocardia sp. NPDC020380 TaxID=3364309 RepID=UPI0037AF4861